MATGGWARRLNCPGADLEGVHYLRTLDDVDNIRARFQPGVHMLIVGGGYVGLEVAAVGVKRGLRVTVVEAAPRVLSRVAGGELSAFYEAEHCSAGVEIVTGASVTALCPSTAIPRSVGSVVLADERTIATDLMLVGIGLLPHTELTVSAALPVDNGVVVDEYCRTEGL